MGALDGRVAVITGGAQGLGAAVGERLSREGCPVVLGDVNEAGVKETAERIEAATGCPAVGMRVDVVEEPEVAALFDRTVERFGRVDLAVANAAILLAAPVESADAESWKRVMTVNLFGAFLTTKHACRIMKPRRQGSIIQINSKSGKRGSARNSAYAASKFGGLGLVQSVALEMAEHGIRCNAICPGNLLDGPLWSDPEKGLFVQYLKAGKVPGATTVEEVRKAYTDQVPLGRGCTYEDVCNLVVYLASDHSAYMTGQAINVTGGQEMR